MSDSRPLTAFEDWVFGTSSKMLAEAREDAAAGNPVDFAKLELKLSIMLVQARALECRHLTSRLLMGRPASLKSITDDLTDRSSLLERMGLAMAKAGGPAPQSPSPIVQHTTDKRDEEPVVEPDSRLIQ